MMNHHLRESLYQLKKDYGRPIGLYKRTTSITVTTGHKVLVRQKIHIRKAIILPSLDTIRGSLDSALSKPGGYIEIADQNVIIDPRELPKGFIVEPDDYVIFDDHTRYEVQSVDTVQFQGGLMLYLKRSKGAQISQIYDIKIKDKLILFQIVHSLDAFNQQSLTLTQTATESAIYNRSIANALILTDNLIEA